MAWAQERRSDLLRSVANSALFSPGKSIPPIVSVPARRPSKNLVALPIPRAGAPTPAPAAARPAIRAARRTAAEGRPAPRIATLAGRRAHKREIHLHRLVEQLGIVRAVDGRARLLQGRVLDQCVALYYFKRKCD